MVTPTRPGQRGGLFEAILGHELKYWQRVFTKSDWPAPPRRMLRLAGQ